MAISIMAMRSIDTKIHVKVFLRTLLASYKVSIILASYKSSEIYAHFLIETAVVGEQSSSNDLWL